MSVEGRRFESSRDWFSLAREGRGGYRRVIRERKRRHGKETQRLSVGCVMIFLSKWIWYDARTAQCKLKINVKRAWKGRTVFYCNVPVLRLWTSPKIVSFFFISLDCIFTGSGTRNLTAHVYVSVYCESFYQLQKVNTSVPFESKS